MYTARGQPVGVDVDVTAPRGIVRGAKGQPVLPGGLLQTRQVDPRRSQRPEPRSRIRRSDGPHDPDVTRAACPDGRTDRGVWRITPAEGLGLAPPRKE